MSMPLPEVLKRRLRPPPQWLPVGVEQPQHFMLVRLKTGTLTTDVTMRCVVASLRPLTLAISLDERLELALETTQSAVLEFFDRDASHTVGWLTLRQACKRHAARADIALYEVLRDHQRCQNWPLRTWTRWLQSRTMRAAVKPGNFALSPAAIHQTMVFYMCPRPVIAVSVQSGEHRNMFPMDLVGPLGSDKFMLALRTTSPSIEAMMASGRVAIADVRAQDVAVAYALGAHHKQSLVNWEELPFMTARSQLYGLPVLENALRVREIAFVDSETIGSHRLFTGRIVTEQLRSSGPQLCHVPGIYQHFRTRLGQPMRPAAS